MARYIAAVGLLLDLISALLGVFLVRAEARHQLGWSLQALVISSILRLLWWLILMLRRRQRSRLDELLLGAFAYVAYVPLAFICLARLVSDPPKVRNDVGFWAYMVLGSMCSWAECFGLKQLRVNEALDIELLEHGEDRAREKKDSVWKLLNLVANEWPLLIQAFICLVVAAIADVLIPHYISQTISLIIQGEERGTLASRPYKRPVISLLIAAAASSVFSACRGATFIVIGGRIAQRLRCSLFKTLMRQEIGFFDITQIGELTSRMTQDCQQVTEQAYLNVNVFLRTLVSIITTLAFMFSITTPLTCVAFVSVPCVVAISMRYSAIFRRISEEAQKSLADANAVANEALGNMPWPQKLSSQ